MNIKKCFVLSLFVSLLTTGCDGVYNLEIYNGRFIEDVTITENNSSNWYDKNENGVTFTDLFNDEYGRDNYYYQKKILSDSTRMGLNYKSDFDLESYDSSGIPYRCYEYFSVVDGDNDIIVSTSNRNLCYDNYKWLNNIIVNVKTNHRVLEHNADQVNGNTYTWNLTRKNATDKSLQIKISKNYYVSNYDNKNVKNLIFVGSIVLAIVIVIGLIILAFIRIQKKANKI